MAAENLALVQGMADTRRTLGRWNAEPWPVVRSWVARSALVAALLLLAVLVVASLAVPDSSRLLLPGVNEPTSLTKVGQILFRNGLVLALHAFACVAGFIAGSSMPLEAKRYGGWWARVHDRAGTLAIGFVVCATTFSLATQAYILGSTASTLSNQFEMSPGVLLLCLLPHAIPELVALFLPLAAWVAASRRGDWHELLAATFVTTALAVPVLVASAFVEVYVSPHLILALHG